jgi:hypothetical protein
VFPELAGGVSGSHYPLPWHRAAAAQAISAVQMAGLAWLFLGASALRLLGVAAEPAWLAALRDNKMALIAAYFGLNLLSSQLGASGAYELFLDGEAEPLYSALASGGAVPDVGQVARLLVARGLEPLPEYMHQLGLAAGGGGGAHAFKHGHGHAHHA